MTVTPSDRRRRTALYRFFDADGSLLYVGIAADPDARRKQHARSAADTWWPLVAERTVEWLDSRSEAEAAERQAIVGERPKFNTSHNPRPDPLLHARDAERARKRASIGARGGAGRPPQHVGLAEHLRHQIDSGAFPVGTPLPRRNQLVKELGVSEPAVQRAYVELAADGYIEERRAKGYFVLPPEGRTVRIPVGRPADAAKALRAAMTNEQVAALVAALSAYTIPVPPAEESS